ncbi:hypothetical protein GCM10017786_11790 [Amycolatopsis deserti]|uniref:Major facilitator superfamily (MFS) profile domain-containing protein n=1 Tax=Amycolatopsis deserti TaxID=185696 RepID=A0ABQ3IFC2_9PSEU|nr:MFS transporter [Amycolatopsis deserti]GHE82561.1 hypothetical protein GCM10017786_11790 [Amycolatopsis deserti]
MPLAVFVLGLAIFCLNTTEVMVAGLLPSLSDGLGVSITAAGNLVTVFALGMVFGGPVLTLALMKAPRRPAMILMLVLFLVGQTLGALAGAYWVMVLARVLLGRGRPGRPVPRPGRVHRPQWRSPGRAGRPRGTVALPLLGGVFPTFAYLSPVLTEVAGFGPGVVPLLFLLGFTGLPLNPAMAARVMRLSNSGAPVNTVNTATIWGERPRPERRRPDPPRAEQLLRTPGARQGAARPRRSPGRGGHHAGEALKGRAV